MINGLLIVDKDDRLVFELTPVMEDALLGHKQLFEAMTSHSVVLIGKTAFSSTFKNQKLHPTSRCFVDKPIEELISKFPLTPIIVVGNKTVMKYFDRLGSLTVIKYNSPGANGRGRKFIAPNAPSRVLAACGTYDVIHYDLHKAPAEPELVN